MKKIILFTFLFFVSFAAFSQLAQNTSETTSSRFTKSTIKVFPNPATEYFQLNGSNDDVLRINIFSIVGKKVRIINDVESDKKYYLDRIPKGLYLVQLIGNDNEILTTQRLNVKKP